jgi:hypothetical protein
MTRPRPYSAIHDRCVRAARIRAELIWALDFPCTKPFPKRLGSAMHPLPLAGMPHGLPQELRPVR